MATLQRPKQPPPVVLTMKRGDTFEPVLAFQGSDTDLGPYDFTQWTGRGQVRDTQNADLQSSLRLEWIDHDVGVFQLFALSDTSGWVTGVLFCDIEFTTDTGAVLSTETFGINVLEDVTRTDPEDSETASAA